MSDTIQSVSTGERVKLNKKLTTLQVQDTEIRIYEEKNYYLANQMIFTDLDRWREGELCNFPGCLAKTK